MGKRRKVASVAFTGVAALGAAGFTAGHAKAASLHGTITPGGHYTAKNVGTATLGDATTGATLTCQSTTAAGNLNATVTNGALGTISKASFNNCSLLGFHFTAHLNHSASLVATAATAGGITKGVLNNISATISGTSGFACHGVVTGAGLPGSYNNSNHHLTIDTSHTAALSVKSATSCLGALNTNDKAYFSAVYSVSPPQTVSVTSP